MSPPVQTLCLPSACDGEARVVTPASASTAAAPSSAMRDGFMVLPPEARDVGTPSASIKRPRRRVAQERPGIDVWHGARTTMDPYDEGRRDRRRSGPPSPGEQTAQEC